MSYSVIDGLVICWVYVIDVSDWAYAKEGRTIGKKNRRHISGADFGTSRVSVPKRLSCTLAEQSVGQWVMGT